MPEKRQKKPRGMPEEGSSYRPANVQRPLSKACRQALPRARRERRRLQTFADEDVDRPEREGRAGNRQGQKGSNERYR